jgi:peptidyl-prolyl cis-trans isomerase A (cyclophilin A)
MDLMPQPSHRAVIHTNHGDIAIDLWDTHAPKTVANFVGLATGAKEWKHPGTGEVTTAPLYDGVIFHRVIKQFMLQGGDPLGQGVGGPGYNFNDEIHPELTFDRPYLLAMANAGKRRNPATGEVEGTNGSQFFITTIPTPWLNGNHTIFGEVVDDESKAVVDAIEAVPTDGRDKPLADVVITGIDVTEL